MVNEIYTKVEKFVIESFEKVNNTMSIKHSLRTAYWLKEFMNDVDEAFLVAAVSHDIERAFRDNKNYEGIKNNKEGYKSENHLLHHQNEGANIMLKYLKEIGADYEFIERVVMLISKHEVGGNNDQNLLKDVDSVSFFENNIEFFLDKQVVETGIEKVREKFQWMFERIDSEKAKQIVKPWYDNAMEMLNRVEL